MTTAFEDEFSDWLEPVEIGKIDKSAGSWTKKHETVGFNESLSGNRIWIADRNQVEFSNRIFLPIEDDDGDDIVIDSTFYIVFSEDFDFADDRDTIIYQVQDRQPFSYYQYALVRAVDI